MRLAAKPGRALNVRVNSKLSDWRRERDFHTAEVKVEVDDLFVADVQHQFDEGQGIHGDTLRGLAAKVAARQAVQVGCVVRLSDRTSLLLSTRREQLGPTLCLG